MFDSEDSPAVEAVDGTVAGTSGTTAAIGAAGTDMSEILQEIRESQKKLDSKFAQFRDEIKRGQEGHECNRSKFATCVTNRLWRSSRITKNHSIC